MTDTNTDIDESDTNTDIDESVVESNTVESKKITIVKICDDIIDTSVYVNGRLKKWKHMRINRPTIEFMVNPYAHTNFSCNFDQENIKLTLSKLRLHGGGMDPIGFSWPDETPEEFGGRGIPIPEHYDLYVKYRKEGIKFYWVPTKTKPDHRSLVAYFNQRTNSYAKDYSEFKPIRRNNNYGNKKIVLFDVDGTLVESGQKITQQTADLLNRLKTNGYEIGIVGGGKLDKVISQMDGKIFFDHYFTENGCVYNQYNQTSLEMSEIYRKNIREHPLYDKINMLIKKSMEFLSKVDYTITGNFIDLRNGIVYVSLIGMSATEEERQHFMELDREHGYRKQLLNILNEHVVSLDIKGRMDIVEGGSVGIAIYPVEYNKIQVLDYLKPNIYGKIYYFGDKHEENGNDYKLLMDERVIGYPVNSVNDTMNALLMEFRLSNPTTFSGCSCM